MMLFDEIIQLMIGLKDDQLKKIKDFILMKLFYCDPTKDKTYTAYFCPICKSKHFIRYGTKDGKQRFKCKNCGKIFTNTTKTIACRSKHDFNMWSKFVSCMVSGMSCRKTAQYCKISHKTAFYWRHKVMGSLNEVLDGKLTLQDIVEADETFIPVSYKGNHRFSKRFTMPRKSRHRGSQSHKRGISNELVCVSCMIDNHNNQQAELACLGKITINQLVSLNRVENGAILVTIVFCILSCNIDFIFKNFLIFYEQGRKMSTWQRYIMGKVQKNVVLTMEISEKLKELNPADQQLFLACYNLDVDKAAEAIRNGVNVNAAIEEDGISSITPLLYAIDHTSVFDINERRQNEY